MKLGSKNTRNFVALIFFSLLIAPSLLFGAMTSTNFQIESDSLSAGGVYQGTSTNFGLGSTIGEFFAFTATSTNFQSLGGFWQMGHEGIVGLSFNTTSVALGQLRPEFVISASQAITVTSTSLGGYSLTINEDGNLRTNEGLDIDDVADGTVTAFSEEYGFSTAGVDGQFNATDAAITAGAPRTIATRATEAHAVITTTTFKAAISVATPSGSYSQTLRYILTANF